MKETTPYSIPKEPGRWRAIILAAVVHAMLFGFFWIGIRWQNEQPVAVEAEVWDMQAKQAAPRPEPKPEPEIKPEPTPPVKQAPAPEKIEEKPVAKPDIVLEQEKKRKAEELKKRQDEEKAKQKKLAEERRIEEEKQKKAEAEQRKIDEAQTKKAEADKKRKEADKKRKQEAEEAERLETLRAENLKRMLGSAAGTGGTGDAPKSQGNNRADADYIQRIASKIKSNITFIVPNDLTGNPPVEFEVRLLPDGSVAGMRKLRSSGVPGFDEAVARAIERSQPYPKDNSGSVPASFTGIHKPKDQ
jgi:colicin import membrane protein